MEAGLTVTYEIATFHERGRVGTNASNGGEHVDPFLKVWRLLH